jgi:hypothetical protein
VSDSLFRGAALAAFLFGAALLLAAEVSGHERVSVEKRSPFALEFSLDLALGGAVFESAAASSSSGDEASSVEAGQEDEGESGVGVLASYAQLGLELLYEARLSLGLGLPLAASFGLGRSGADIPPAALGPPTLSLGYSERLGPWKLGARADFKWGLGASTASTEPRYRPASYPTLGLSLRAARFLDPLALGLSLRLATELPRPEAGGARSWRPFSAGLSLFATEALNDRVSLGLSLEQRLRGPRRLEAGPGAGSGCGQDREAWSYELAPALSVSVSRGEFLATLGLVGPESRASASLGIAYTLRLGDRAVAQPRGGPRQKSRRGGGYFPLSAEEAISGR